MDEKINAALRKKIQMNLKKFAVLGLMLMSSYNLFSQEDNKDKEFFNSGLKKAQEGQLEGAIADFTTSINAAESKLGIDPKKLPEGFKLPADSKLAQAYYFRGVAQSNIGKEFEGIADLGSATKYDKNFGEAYLLRGQLYNNKHSYKDARENLELAVKLLPNNYEAWFNFGVANFNLVVDFPNLGYDKQAIENFTSAIKIESNHVQSYIERAKSYIQMEQFNEALADANKAISMDSRNSEAHFIRGIIHRHLENYDFAIRDYTNAIIYDSQNSVAYYNRGITYSKMDEHQKAIQDFSKAIEIYPDDAQAYLNRGIEKLFIDKTDDACSDFKKASDIGGDAAADAAKLRTRLCSN